MCGRLVRYNVQVFIPHLDFVALNAQKIYNRMYSSSRLSH